MSIAYRHPIDGENEFPLLVEDWAELCAGISDADFTAACKLHKMRSAFFPVPANIITAHEELKPHAPMAALPEPPESKTPGLGRLVFEAFRGDQAAKDRLENLRPQYGSPLQ